MNQLNSVIVEGNVVKEPFFSEPTPGFKVADFSIGVNRYSKAKNGEWKEEVSYIAIQSFNKLAEVAREKCSKGRGVRIVGRLKQDRWKNSDNKWESKMYVIAEHVEFKPMQVSQNSADENAKKDDFEKMTAADLAAMKLAEAAAATQESVAEEALF